MAKSETNHLWISGSSRTVEEIAWAAFTAGLETGVIFLDYVPVDEQISMFRAWLNETRQSMNDDSESAMRQHDVQGSG